MEFLWLKVEKKTSLKATYLSLRCIVCPQLHCLGFLHTAHVYITNSVQCRIVNALYRFFDPGYPLIPLAPARQVMQLLEQIARDRSRSGKDRTRYHKTEDLMRRNLYNILQYSVFWSYEAMREKVVPVSIWKKRARHNQEKSHLAALFITDMRDRTVTGTLLTIWYFSGSFIEFPHALVLQTRWFFVFMLFRLFTCAGGRLRDIDRTFKLSWRCN